MTISKKYKNSNIKILEKEFTGFAASNKLRTGISVDNTTGNNFVADNIPQVVTRRLAGSGSGGNTLVKSVSKKIKKTPLIDTTKLLTQ